MLALNAVRIEMPTGPVPTSVVPFERKALYGFLDRDTMDVFARRLDAFDMAVVPLTADAKLPGPRRDLRAQDHPSLVSALAREAVFRLLLDLRDQGYRVTGRRPPVVETARFENELPEGLANTGSTYSGIEVLCAGPKLGGQGRCTRSKGGRDATALASVDGGMGALRATSLWLRPPGTVGHVTGLRRGTPYARRAGLSVRRASEFRDSNRVVACA